MKRRLFIGILACVMTFCALASTVAAASGDILWVRYYDRVNSADQAFGIARDSTGIYVVGYDSNPPMDRQWRIQKSSLATGAVLWSRSYNPTILADTARDVAVDSTGVYVVGYANEILLDGGGDTYWVIQKRTLSTGAVVWTRTWNPSATRDEAYGVAVDSTGIYVVGQGIAQKRSKTNGNVIWSKALGFSAYDIACDSTGIYVVGSGSAGAWPNTNWRIQKRSLATGLPLAAGTYNPSTGDDRAMAVAVDGTGVYLAGYDSTLGANNARWRVQKLSLRIVLSRFSILWTKTHDPSSRGDSALGIAVGSTGVYVVGYDLMLGVSNAEWRILKLSRTTGTTSPGWPRTVNLSSGWDVARAVAVDSTGVYTIGERNSPSSWRIEKRVP